MKTKQSSNTKFTQADRKQAQNAEADIPHV